MQQRKLQKKKDLVISLTQTIAEKVFKIAKQIKSKKNDTVVGDKCVKNDKGELALTDTEKHLTWTEDYERLLNEEFSLNKENSVLEDAAVGPQQQINKDSVKCALTKIKRGKVSGTSGVVTETLLASGDAGLERISSLFNCILMNLLIGAQLQKLGIAGTHNENF